MHVGSICICVPMFGTQFILIMIVQTVFTNAFESVLRSVRLVGFVVHVWFFVDMLYHVRSSSYVDDRRLNVVYKSITLDHVLLLSQMV